MELSSSPVTGLNIPNNPLNHAQFNENNKKDHKKIVYLFTFFLFIVIILGFLLFTKNYQTHTNHLTGSVPNLSSFGNEFIIYQKDGYIWKWDFMTNKITKIIAYGNPGPNDTIIWSISPDNQRLLLTLPKKGLIAINLATKFIRTIDPTGGYGLYAPNNQDIYYIGDKKIISENCIEGTPCWTSDTIVANRNGTDKHILPANVLNNLSPQAWSPDSKNIVFSDSNESGFQGISTINVQTNVINELVKTSDNYGTFFSPSWSPNGTSICSFYGYFYSDPKNPNVTITANSVYVINVASKKISITKPFTYGTNSLCYWSPNSNFFGIITGDSEISIYSKSATLVNKINLPGSIMMGSSDSWKEITWSPDDNFILINSSKNLYLVNLHTDEFSLLASGVSQTNFSTYWSNK